MSRHKPLPLFITASQQLIALSSSSVPATQNKPQQKQKASHMYILVISDPFVQF
jgi:hypothetical protein